MLEFLKKLSASRIVVSTIFIIIGLLCVIIPLTIISVVSLVFGIFLFLYAVFQLANILNIANPKVVGVSIVSCTICFILGLVLILNNDAGTIAVGLAIGIGSLILGLVHLSQSKMLKSLRLGYLDKLVVGILEILIAILMFCHLKEMVAIQIIILGVLLILYGIYTLSMFIFLYKRGKQLEESRQNEIANSNTDATEIIIEDDENKN